MIPLTKVKQIISTYETLEKELSSGNIDKKDFVFLLSLLIIDETDNSNYFLYKLKLTKKLK